MIITSFEGFANPPVNPDALPKLYYDFETYYDTEYSLTKMSPMEYIFSPQFRYQSVSWAYDDGPIQFAFGQAAVEKWVNETPWEQVEAIAHNGEGFDHLIVAWRHGRHAALWGDTLCMARPWYSNICQNALGKLAAYLGYQEKLSHLHTNFKGKQEEQFTKHDIENMKLYNDADVEIMRRFYKDHIHLFPWYERLILDDTIRMSTELRLRVNQEKAEKGVAELEGKQRQLIMRSMDYLLELGIDAVKPLQKVDRSTPFGLDQAYEQVKKIVGSGPKFAAVLEAYDIEPGMKPAKGAKAKAAIDAGLPCPETFAFAKDDDFMQELLEHDDPEIVALAELRISVKSTQKYTRMQTFARVAKVMGGWLPARAAYCAAHTGRPGGRDYNLLNLPRNVFSGKTLVEKSKLREAVEAPPGYKLVVVDLSGIELRLNNYLWMHAPAVQAWAKDREADIYSMTATNLFGRQISKKENPTERQIGKTCIAEGELVLTDYGLIPIEEVSTLHKVWDGVEWVAHDGVVCQGFKEVITHDSLTATKDHEVYLDDGSKVRFDHAQELDYCLARTGDGGRAVRLGENNQRGDSTRQEPRPSSGEVYGLRHGKDYRLRELIQGSDKGLPSVFAGSNSAPVVGTANDRSKTTLHQSKRPGVSELRGAWHPISIRVRDESLLLGGGQHRARKEQGTGPDRQRGALRSGEFAMVNQIRKFQQSENNSLCHDTGYRCVDGARPPRIQASLPTYSFLGSHAEKSTAEEDGTGSAGAVGETGLQTKRRVWDILNAGPRHRFTVSGRLVSNCDLGCGYGAGHHAVYRQAKRDEQLRQVLTSQQMETFVNIWRKTHPEITDGWKRCDTGLAYIATGDSSYQIDPWGMLRVEKDKIRLPSGRYLFYPNLRQEPKVAKNGRQYKQWVFGINRSKKMYGALQVENLIQALARDAFQEKVMLCKWRYNIRAALTVYDEMVAVVPEALAEWALDKMLEVFCEPISWWPQVVLFAEGDIADNYADAK